MSSKNFSGLTIEHSIAQICHECRLPIVNTGTLAVCRYRGTQGQQPTLYYHKECLFKSTMRPFNENEGRRGVCPQCGGNKDLDFVFTYGLDSQYKYHKKCVDDFLQRHESESEFNVSNDIMAAVLNSNSDTFPKAFSAVKSVQQLDYLFTIISDLDLLERSLSLNRIARTRYITEGPSRPYKTDYAQTKLSQWQLRQQYLKKHFKEIFERGDLKSKKKWTGGKMLEAQQAVAEEMSDKWDTLSISLKEDAIRTFLSLLSSQCISKEWNNLSMETKAAFCKEGHIDFEFYEAHLKSCDELFHFLSENKSRLDDRVKLIVDEEQNVLAKSW